MSVFKVLRENPLLILYLVCGTLYAAAYGEYTFIMPLDMAAVHGDDGAVIFGTASSLNCIIVVLFTPVITRVFRRMRETGKMLTGRIFIFAGYMVFLLMLGVIPGYYLAMLVFTWGEIFDTIADGPYVSTRIPASHRGRINGLMTVAYTAVTGGVDIAVGQIYDHAGSTWAWTLILSVTLLSAAATIVLKIRDKKVYPKLYLTSAEEEAADAAKTAVE